MIQSHKYSLTHYFNCSLSHSFAHSITHSLTHSFRPSNIHSGHHLFNQPVISHTHSSTLARFAVWTLTHSLTLYLVHPHPHAIRYSVSRSFTPISHKTYTHTQIGSLNLYITLLIPCSSTQSVNDPTARSVLQ